MKTTVLWLLVCFTSVCQASTFSFPWRLEESETPPRRVPRDTDGAVLSGKALTLLEQLRMEFQSLRAEKQGHEALEKTYKEMVQFNEDQAVHYERRVKAEFQQLQNVLQEEEQKVLTALREEKLTKNKNINLERQKISEKQNSLNGNVKVLEKLLQTGNSSPQPQTPATQLEPKAGLLLDQAKLLGNLGDRVWNSVRKSISSSSVILDPNTANRWLHVSEDLKGVRQGPSFQKVPLIPERFTRYASILGSEGFSSGVHQWDVEVGDHPDWNVGVVKESVDRKGQLVASPNYGIWAVVLRGGNYTTGRGGNNSTSLRFSIQTLKTLRVKLNYDQGEVSFYNVDDAGHMTLLYTHTGTFTEKIFPYFSVGKAGDAKTKEIRILPDDPPQTHP